MRQCDTCSYCHFLCVIGIGSPAFVTETECTYFFEWKTQYACLDHPVGKSCRVDFGGQHYDLSPLVRETGSNWQALDGQHVHSQDEQGEYFINVCGEILSDSQHDFKECQGKSAACFIGESPSLLTLVMHHHFA